VGVHHCLQYCFVCFSGSVISQWSADSFTGNNSSSIRNSLCTSAVSILPNGSVPYTSEFADVITTDSPASSNNFSCGLVADTAAGDKLLGVGRRTIRDHNDNQVKKICEVCGKSFRHYESFRSHKRKHSRQLALCHKPFLRCARYRQQNPTRILCEICGLRTNSRVIFACHMRTYHPSTLGISNSDAPYQCRMCKQRFFQSRALRRHVRLVHVPSLPTMKTSWFRRQQRPRNSGLPSCVYCCRCFRSRLALEAHELLHLDLKPHRCDVCDRGFRQSVHLTVHRRTHTKECPFKCSACPKAYRNRIDLRKHSSSVHGIDLPVRRRRGFGGIDVVAAAVAAADIGPDDDVSTRCP